VAFTALTSRATGPKSPAIHLISSKCELKDNTCEVKIEGSGLSADQLKNETLPVLKDALPADPALTFENEPQKAAGGTDGNRTWFFLVKVAAAPVALPQDRKIEIAWDNIAPAIFPLTLVTASGPAGATIKWTVEPPVTPWNLGQGRWTDFTVTTADRGLTSIVLKHSTYLDGRPGRGARIPLDQFYLCPERTTDMTKCSKEGKLAGTTSTFWLTIDPRFDKAGTYTGNLEIDTAPHTDIKSISPAINQTDFSSQIAGFLLIVAGVTAAWLVLAFGRGSYARNQALLPAVLLRERAASLVLELKNLPGPLNGSAPNTNRDLVQVMGKLTESYLDGQQYLPPKVPSAFGGATIQAAGYQTFLQTQSQMVDDLEAIVNQGILRAAQKWSPAILAGDLTLLLQLIGNLDNLATTLPQPLNTVQTSIANLLASWHPTVVAQAAGAADYTISPGAPKGKTSFQILLQIEAISIMFWIVWAVLTSLAGLLVLILPNVGFGGAMDFVQCFLWGFGLPVAGQSLQQLTISSINTQLGITLPKP
jgi:hypothetical protein